MCQRYLIVKSTSQPSIFKHALKTRPTKGVVFFLFLMLLFCDSAAAYQPRNNYGARLEPIGKVLHGAGQDLDGFSNYTNVMDANEHPTVFMAYYNIWDRFAGPLRTQLDSFREFNDSYLSVQIGLYLVDSYQQIAAGGLDEQV
jgi:hypothetical protein